MRQGPGASCARPNWPTTDLCQNSARFQNKKNMKDTQNTKLKKKTRWQKKSCYRFDVEWAFEEFRFTQPGIVRSLLVGFLLSWCLVRIHAKTHTVCLLGVRHRHGTERLQAVFVSGPPAEPKRGGSPQHQRHQPQFVRLSLFIIGFRGHFQSLNDKRSSPLGEMLKLFVFLPGSLSRKHSLNIWKRRI